MGGLRIMVTGGAGFLGSHLCERLLDDGHDVVCVDSLVTGRIENLRYLLRRPGFVFLEHDVRLPLDLAVERVYHLACPASPRRFQDDPTHVLETAVVGTLHLLRLAERHGARFLQASTSEVYGDPEVHPQPEGYRGKVSCTGPRACYDEGKRAAETACLDFVRTRGLQARVARIFNTYGPRMDPDDGRVVSNFVVQALRGENLTIFGDGSQTRSFCYVDDLVDGLVRAMEAPHGFTGPVNLGNPAELRVRELAELVLSLTGSLSKLVEHPRPEDDPTRRRPDISLARQALGWEPKVTLAEGLPRTIAWFRGALARASSSRPRLASLR